MRINYFEHESGIATLTISAGDVVLVQFCSEDDAQRIQDIIDLTVCEEVYLDRGGRYGEFRVVARKGPSAEELDTVLFS